MRFYARRGRTMDMVSAIIQAKQDAGRICSAYPAQEIASLILTIYMTEVRRWINGNEHPDMETGVAHLRKLLSIALCGVKPAEGEAEA